MDCSVCHWAWVFLKHCGASVPADKKLCVLLAGLCHDLGHGPFSHLWERFLHRCGVQWKHEANSVLVLKELIANNNLRPVFKKHGLEEEHIEMIFRLIEGNPPEDEEDLFLYEIVANSETGLDVDKFEYIMRDSKMFGMKFTLDIERILHNIKIEEYEGAKHVCFREKISETLLDVFQHRAKLHRTCYQHIACKAVELMLIDALVAADDHFRITWRETLVTDDGTEVRKRSCRLSECHLHTNAFLKATDCLFYDLQNSTDPQLEESRSLLEAMSRRDLYTLVFHKALKLSSAELRRIESEMVHQLNNDDVGKENNCQFRSSLKHYGIGQSWSNVLFFEKNSKKPFKKSSDDIKRSSFIGDRYDCAELLVFCTKRKKSMTDEVLNNIKNRATKIFNTLAQNDVFQEISIR